MMSTYTISGNNLRELPKGMLYQHFSHFGAMSDHIVRNKGHSPKFEESAGMRNQLTASFTIAYRSLSRPEHELLGQSHLIDGVEVVCFKQENSTNIADRKVFIKYLEKKAAARDIEESLSAYGQIEHVHVSMKKDKSMNLGLCNVLFKSKDAVKKILSEQNIFIKGKKVKVEPYKCQNSSNYSHGPYTSSIVSSDSRLAHNLQNWSAPQLQDKSEKGIGFSPYSGRHSSLKTPRSVFDMPSMRSEVDAENYSQQPLTPVLNLGSCKLTVTRGTGDSRDQFDLLSKIGDTVPLLNGIQSLDFSLIEEECEDSPRPRRNSQTPQQTFRAFEEPKSLDCVQGNAIISLHGDLPAEVKHTKTAEKDSFHSVRPTSHKYYKNPRHHLVGMVRNHNDQNLCFKRITATIAAPLPEAAIMASYRLF
jgi:RNA recognition motif-containing protein